MPPRDDAHALLDSQGVLDWLADFGATLAHDLNQPLAAAGNYISAARQIAGAQGAASPALNQAMDKAGAQIARASETLRRLRSALTPGEPQFRETSLHARIREASERVERGASAEIELRLDAGEDSVQADEAQLEWALGSLMRATVEASDGLLAVLTWAAPRAVRVEILAPAAEEPPPRVEARIAFGVALARAIIEAHDGALEAMPDGDGFAVTLPLADGSA